MEFRNAYDHFEQLGFEFTFDDPSSWAWSNCHVIWRGVEFGVMYQDYMTLRDGDGTVHQYSYRGFYPDKEIYDLVNRFLMNAPSIATKTLIETKRDRANQVRDYFARKRDAVRI